MKVILKTRSGETVRTTDLITLLEFPNFILSQGHLYRLIEQNLSEATYQWEPYLHL